MKLSFEPLIDFCTAEAARRLERSDTFAPFGAVMVGNSDPKGVDAEGHIEAVEEELSALVRGGVVRAVAVADAVELEEEMPDGSTEAIRIHTEAHGAARSWVVPYRRLRKGLLGIRRDVETGDPHGEIVGARFFV